MLMDGHGIQMYFITLILECFPLALEDSASCQSLQVKPAFCLGLFSFKVVFPKTRSVEGSDNVSLFCL